jgi:acyl-CoA synthetase (AMP-forming)/AMP-acid ligase II
VALLTLLGWLREPSGSRGVRFHGAGGWELVTHSELASLVRAAAAGLVAEGVGEDQRVALVLPAGPTFAASFFGALLAGAVPAPVAPPTAFTDRAAYRRHLEGVLRAAAPALVLAAPEHLAVAREAAADGVAARLATFEELLERGRGGPAPGGRTGSLGLLQFTSGSSGPPRGVRVPLSALEANVDAIRGWLELTEADQAASWLPVHHDLGLVGCLLAPVAAGCDLWLMRPRDFLRRPRRWLECLGRLGASLTATPNFGLEHVAARLLPRDLAGLDLGGCRGVVVGAERLRAEAFERFAALLARAGLRRAAMLPAYGLAEATLAVTGLPLEEEWRAVSLDPSSLAFGSAVEPDPAGVRVVGCGRPLAGVEVAVEDGDGVPLPEGRVGEVVVRGAAVAGGYAGGEAWHGSTRFDGATLRTGDAGFLLDGQLFVLGRLGDSLKLRGRSLFAEELEAALLDSGVPFAHVAVALGVREGVPTAVALFDRDVEPWRQEALEVLGRRLEGGEVVLAQVPSGGIARTSSGKPRRRLIWQQFCDGGLPVRVPAGR